MGKKLLAGLVTSLFLISTIGFANADLVEEDLFTPGDGLLTYDTDTGLYWLDLTVTHQLSYNDVLSEISVGGSLEGFWFATTADIDVLQVSAGLDPGLFNVTYPPYIDSMSQLIDLVGITESNEDWKRSCGITSDLFELYPPTILDRICRCFKTRYTAEASQAVIADNIASPSLGSWLITDTLPDIDNDGISDYIDNCIDTPNPNQEDFDSDGFGDACDVCPDNADDQTDSDNDGYGDACEECPTDPNKILTGVCGCGTTDADSDNDGTADCNDQCPLDINKVIPGICGCGTQDTDSDYDGTLDCNDQCPLDANKVDQGQCGCGNTDIDSDSDTIADCIDICIYDANNDSDNDTICGDIDNCPDTANIDQFDLDGDSIGDACDPDADNDGFTVDDDCNDLNETINPAQCDIKDDGIDQDCDGSDRTTGKPCSGDGGDEDPPTTEPEGRGDTCSDGIDNDGDGLMDCNDSDCAKNKSCK